MVLMLCFIFSTAFSNIPEVARTEKQKKDGTPIEVIEKSSHNGSERSSSIQASIDGNTLTIVFTENLGQVAIEITTATGTHMDFMSLPTPNGFQFFIMTPGDYIVTFTLSNGDEYYGEFTVTN